MSDLQLALMALGGVFILAVIAFNAWQERKARGKAEKAFGAVARDALFEAPGGRREPTLGNVPVPTDVVEAAEEIPLVARVEPEELEAPGGPSAEISAKVDTVAVILADGPIRREQLAPLEEALREHTTPVHIEGIVDEQWHPIEESPRQSWRELRVGLQLASRAGALGEEEIERFNRTIAEFAASVSAVSQREAAPEAAARARDLDGFCAEADIEVAVNVIGQFGASFPAARVRQLALDHGMSQTASDELVSFGPDGTREFVIRRFEDPHHKAPPGNYPGLTFALDLPQVADPAGTLDTMVQVARGFAESLAGQLVDDNRKPLTDAGLASIRRSLDKILRDMEVHGVPAGSPLARRLFS